jgi:hypothetical protein
MMHRLLTIGLCLALTACATVPDVTVKYYFPRAETQFVLTQTIGCTPKPKPAAKGKVPDVHRAIRSVISVAATTTNSADLDWVDVDSKTGTTSVHQGHIFFKNLNGVFFDADGVVTLTPDGRLSGINATSAGKGGTLIKDLVTVAGALAPLAALDGNHDSTIDDACKQVDDHSAVMQAGTLDPDKPVPSLLTLTYSVFVQYGFNPADLSPALYIDQDLSPGYKKITGSQTSILFVADAPSGPAYKDLHDILHERMESRLELKSDITNLRYLDTTSSTEKGDSKLELTSVAVMKLAVTGHVADFSEKTQVWAGSIPAPTHQTYYLPIPTPQPFGNTAFGLGLSDFGSVNSLHYGSNTGAPDLSDAFGSIATALKPKTTADRAKEIQDQADLIAQQQRLIVCQTTPTQCK